MGKLCMEPWGPAAPNFNLPGFGGGAGLSVMDLLNDALLSAELILSFGAFEGPGGTGGRNRGERAPASAS